MANSNYSSNETFAVINSDYSSEPLNEQEFTEYFDKVYTRIAGLYDLFVKVFPFWKNWLLRVLDHLPVDNDNGLSNKAVLEVSFGTGYLMTQYAHKFDTVHGVDLNHALLEKAKNNLQRNGIHNAELIQGNVEKLPYNDNAFDFVINTMAFTGYPNGIEAMSELHRVLKPDGKLIIIDINYPNDQNFLGNKITLLWMAAGDIIRDMRALFRQFHFDYIDEEIGGFGSVHLYVATPQKEQ